MRGGSHPTSGTLSALNTVSIRHSFHTFMKTLPALAIVAALSSATLHAAPQQLTQREPARAAGKVASDLFWVADSRKMDEFLAPIQLSDFPGADSREVLPDTRTAWWDYAREAKGFAVRGKYPEARARIGQMLKLAAVYRHFGGLENVVRSEEIRYLAGCVAEESGSAIAGRIESPFLEKNAAECLANLEAKAGDNGAASSEFWQHLRERARLTHARLTGQPGATLSRR